MSSLEIVVVVSCPAGAGECLAKMREVLDCVERAGPRWPPLDEWERALPEWFVRACAPPMSTEDAQTAADRWRAMSRTEQARVADLPWSLPAWLYWMEPSNSVWQWARAKHRSAIDLEVTLAVDGFPVALGAFDWLARAAGAERIAEMA